MQLLKTNILGLIISLNKCAINSMKQLQDLNVAALYCVIVYFSIQ